VDPVRALALALFDRGRGVPEERLAWAAEDLRSFLDHAGPRTSFAYWATLYLVEWMPLLVIGRFARMSRLSTEQRIHYLEAFERSRFAILLVLPKALLALVYYEHPESLRETGYDGGCLMGQVPEGVGLVRSKLPLIDGHAGPGDRLR
jgi:hypothetical protein